MQQQANLEKAKLDCERGQGLFKDGLIPKQDFDQRKTTYDAAVAGGGFLEGAGAVAESASWTRRARMVSQSRAVLVRTQDILAQNRLHVADQRHRELSCRCALGEYVVPGIQNANGSFLMTLSDMSVVTAEVKVDETDIVNVRIGQDADVTIDAVPGQNISRAR